MFLPCSKNWHTFRFFFKHIQQNGVKFSDTLLDTTRTSEQPSATMPGTVDKIIPSPGPSQPEKAQIAIEEADHGYQDLRIENTLTDENGDDVTLKKGAHVEVTVTAEPTAPTKEDS
jgi:hypothetical protein